MKKNNMIFESVVYETELPVLCETLHHEWTGKIITYLKKVEETSYEYSLGFFKINKKPIITEYYTIEQAIPYIPNPDFLCEINTNQKLTSYALTEYEKVKIWAIKNCIRLNEKKRRYHYVL